MQPVAAQRALYKRQNAYTMGPKLGPQIWKLGYQLMGPRNDSEKQLFASRSTWAFRGLD